MIRHDLQYNVEISKAVSVNIVYGNDTLKLKMEKNMSKMHRPETRLRDLFKTFIDE
jgi:hypothetical protein